MQILIIEDEYQNFRHLQQLLLGMNPGLDIIGPLESNDQVESFAATHEMPDLVFADIRLADGLSFHALSQLPPTLPIIFITAYDEYMQRAFDFNSISYLMKPIEEEDLRHAMTKLSRLRMTDNGLSSIADVLGKANGGQPHYRERFLVPCHDGYKVVPIKEINHISSESGITHLWLNDRTSANVDMSLGDLEQQLDPERFFRANRQFVVNIDHVSQVKTWFNYKTRLQLDLYPEVEIVVSKERTSDLKKWLNR